SHAKSFNWWPVSVESVPRSPIHLQEATRVTKEDFSWFRGSEYPISNPSHRRPTRGQAKVEPRHSDFSGPLPDLGFSFCAKSGRFVQCRRPDEESFPLRCLRFLL